eukprot:TRINITY_DN14083_c0_g1_i1.p1 TRINITY_DN14083_c0_g1~~TRINITY_DN14083_c0_g1_i1.p1  ORF type:complete len:300 (+),score=63.51 TRINITY_DN14083_c0_g1_i1:78-977(+)
MPKKKKQTGPVETGSAAPKPWCYYCGKKFSTEGILIQHQREKHFKCGRCSKQLMSAVGLRSHSATRHQITINAVPNATIPGRDGFDMEINGMKGVPFDLLSEEERVAFGLQAAAPDAADPAAYAAMGGYGHPMMPGMVPGMPGMMPGMMPPMHMYPGMMPPHMPMYPGMMPGMPPPMAGYGGYPPPGGAWPGQPPPYAPAGVAPPPQPASGAQAPDSASPPQPPPAPPAAASDAEPQTLADAPPPPPPPATAEPAEAASSPPRPARVRRSRFDEQPDERPPPPPPAEHGGDDAAFVAPE